MRLIPSQERRRLHGTRRHRASRALTTCVTLLVDPEPAARAGALRALGASGRPDVALLMRLFAQRGDVDPGVLAEAFVALLALSSDDPVPFVAERLASGDRDVARAAAMALGDARRPEAVGALREHLTREDRPDVRHAVILALATSRDDDAFAVLLELIARGTAADSKAAADALGLYAHDAALQRQTFKDCSVQFLGPVRRLRRKVSDVLPQGKKGMEQELGINVRLADKSLQVLVERHPAGDD